MKTTLKMLVISTMIVGLTVQPDVSTAQAPPMSCTCSGTHLNETYQIGTWTFNDAVPGGGTPVSCACNDNAPAQNGDVTLIANTGIRFNSVRGGAKNRTFKLISQLSDVSWTADFKVEINPAGSALQSYFPAVHLLIVQANYPTDNNLYVNTNTTNTWCDGNGTVQNPFDAIWVSLESNPPPSCPDVAGGNPAGFNQANSNWRFVVRTRNGQDFSTATMSAPIPCNGLNVYYIRLQRSWDSWGVLSVFSDAGYTNHIPGSPICYAIAPDVKSLNMVQHAGGSQGQCNRTFSGIISGLKICNTNTCPLTLAPQITSGGHFCGTGSFIASGTGGSAPVPLLYYMWTITECTNSGGTPVSPLVQYSSGWQNSVNNTINSITSSNITLYSPSYPSNPSQLQCNRWYKIELAVQNCGNPWATATQMVRIDCLPEVNAGPDQFICQGKCANIGLGPWNQWQTYTWTPTTALTSNPPNSPFATVCPTSSTTYTLSTTDPNTGCSNQDAVGISVLPLPAVDAGADQMICNGSPGLVPIGSYGNNSLYTYSWNPSSGLVSGCSMPPLAPWVCPHPLAAPTVTTTYTLTATGTNGCTNTDVVTVNVSHTVADAGPDQLICYRTSPFFNSAVLAASPNNSSSGASYSYSWVPSTGTFSNPGTPEYTVSPTMTTTYTLYVTYTAPNGQTCVSSDAVTVTVDHPVADAGPDKPFCVTSNTPASIGVTNPYPNGTTFSWVPATNLSSTTVQNPNASPTVTTTYTLYITDVNGCTAMDNVTVTPDFLVADAGPAVYSYAPTTPPGWVLGGTPLFTGSPSGYGGVQPYNFNWQPCTDPYGYLSSCNGNVEHPSFSNQVPCAYPDHHDVTYTLVVTDALGCTASDQITMDDVCDGNRVVNPNLDEEDGFSIFPNPNSGSFTIQFGDQEGMEMDLLVTDVLGENIFERRNYTAEKALQMDLQKFPKGVYFIRLDRKDGTRKVRKIVIE